MRIQIFVVLAMMCRLTMWFIHTTMYVDHLSAYPSCKIDGEMCCLFVLSVSHVFCIDSLTAKGDNFATVLYCCYAHTVS